MFIRRENFKQYIKLYPVVSSIIAINFIVFIITLIPGIGKEILYAGMSVNAFIAAGEWWRIITSMFLHAGFSHVLFNMFSLFLFGPELEKIAGKIRFLTIYFLAGIFGGAAVFRYTSSRICKCWCERCNLWYFWCFRCTRLLHT